MLDVARGAALVWALLVAWRARAWPEAAAIGFAVYVFALEVASAFFCDLPGASVPLATHLVVLLGPSGMPRGTLPPLPLAALIVEWPALTTVLTAASLLFARSRLMTRTAAMHAVHGQGALGGRDAVHRRKVLRRRRVASALAAAAVLVGLCAVARQWPGALGHCLADE